MVEMSNFPSMIAVFFHFIHFHEASTFPAQCSADVLRVIPTLTFALRRTAQAKAEAQEAAEQAARRARGAREAEEAAQRMAVAEMDATGREMEDGIWTYGWGG